MPGPDDWVILVYPPGAETASISHGAPRQPGPAGWLMDSGSHLLF